MKSLHWIFSYPDVPWDLLHFSDSYLFLDEGLNWLADTDENRARFKQFSQLYVLKYDIQRIGTLVLLPQVSVIDDAQWVQLTQTHHPIISW